MTAATFNPTLKSSWWTLSNGNQTATKASGGDSIIPLQFFRSGGDYWDEFSLDTSSNVEFQGVGVGSASCPWTTTGTYPGQAGAFNSGIYWRGSAVWEYAYNDVTSTFSGPNLANGAVVCILTKMSTRKFFIFVRPAGGGAGSWVGDDPNTTPAGGFAFGVSGDVCPFWYSYYNSTVASHRTAAQQTEFSNAPSGTIQCWNDDTGATAVGQSVTLQWSGISQVTKSLDLKWNGRSVVAKAVTLQWSGFTVVPKAITFQWSGIAQVTKSLDARWNGYLAINKTLDVKWSGRSLVTKSLDAKYNTYALIGKSTTLQWNGYTAAGKSITVQWSAVAQVTKSLDIKWNTISSSVVGVSLNVPWNGIAHVAASTTLPWNILNGVAKAVTLQWSAREAIGKNADLPWATRSQVTKLVDLRWTGLVSVSKTVDLPWAMRSLAGRDLDARYSVLMLGSKSLGVRWSVLGQTIEQPDAELLGQLDLIGLIASLNVPTTLQGVSGEVELEGMTP